MIFDTDVLIWALRGNQKAAKAIDGCDDRFISAVTYMELIQGARNKAEQKTIKDFLSMLDFQTLPVNENISLRATVFMEEFCLKSGMGLADALIFATANESGNSFPDDKRVSSVITRTPGLSPVRGHRCRRPGFQYRQRFLFCRVPGNNPRVWVRRRNRSDGAVLRWFC